MSESIDFVEATKRAYVEWLADQENFDETKFLSMEQVATLASTLWANRFDSTNEVFEKAVSETVANKVEQL